MALEGVSIAMATFNGERFLAAQLSSLVSQTVKPLELVVCDDRSTDSTYTMLQAFAKEAPFPVRLFQNDANVGYRSNFTRAGSLCRGSFIFFCDQDDIWRKDKIARVLEYFATSDSLTVSHDLRVFFEDGRPPIGSYFEFLRLSGFSPALSVKGCATAFRSELIERFGWPDQLSNVSHDTWVCLMAAVVKRRGYLCDALIDYRIHEQNASGLLLGGNKRLARLLRRLRLPPFTSKDELDLTWGYFLPSLVPDEKHEVVRSAISSARAQIDARDRHHALAGLARAVAIRELVTCDAYAHPVRRSLKALHLFLRLAYRSSEGLQGLLLDILGRRT